MREKFRSWVMTIIFYYTDTELSRSLNRVLLLLSNTLLLSNILLLSNNLYLSLNLLFSHTVKKEN